MKKGDIILVKFPFTDLTDYKVRPALVIVAEKGCSLPIFDTMITRFSPASLPLGKNRGIIPN